MKVIETINNIDFILPNENNINFINDKALVKLVGLARNEHHFNKDQDRKLSNLEFKDLLCSFTNDESLLHTLINKYQNGVLNTKVYALIDRNFKECNLTVNDDVYLKEFVSNKFKINRAFCTKNIKRVKANDFIITDDTGTFHIKLDGNNIIACKLINNELKKTNLPNVLKSKHKLYNLDTMKESRYYDYIGDFEEFVKKDGKEYNAAHVIKNITIKENIDGIKRAKSCTLDFFINEEGKIISPIASSIDDDLLIGGDSCFDEIVKVVTIKLRETLKNSVEDTLVKRFLMKRKNHNK